MHLSYDLNKIKFATDEATFKRAIGLYESGKVTELEQLGGYYSPLFWERNRIVSLYLPVTINMVIAPVTLEKEIRFVST